MIANIMVPHYRVLDRTVASCSIAVSPTCRAARPKKPAQAGIGGSANSGARPDFGSGTSAPLDGYPGHGT